MQGLRFTFPKSHRLVGKKNIETLLSKGEAFFVHPYRIVFRNVPIPHNGESPIKLVIAVPKRKCKLAVQRNSIKRITREAYRLQQHLLLPSAIVAKMQVQVMLQYIQSETVDANRATIAVQKILITLQKKLVLHG